MTEAVPAVMRAAVLHGRGDLRIEERPVPPLAPGEVLVRVRSVGVCGSDVHYFTEGRIGDIEVTQPTVMGHEAAGEVAAVGPDEQVVAHPPSSVIDAPPGAGAPPVEGLAVGDRVAIEPSLPCGRCEWCRSGRYNVCPAVKHLGTPPVDGIFQTYFAATPGRCYRFPAAISFDQGAMLEPLSVGLHAVHLVPARPGDTAVVLGSGPIGLMTLSVARLAGAARIIATDLLDDRLALARRFGATETLNASRTPVAEAILDLTGGRGADVVYEAAGVPETFQQALAVACRSATVAFIGIYAPGACALDLHDARRKELTVRFIRRFRFAYPRAIDLVSRGAVEVASLITHHFDLAETARAFELVAAHADGVVRAVIRP